LATTAGARAKVKAPVSTPALNARPRMDLVIETCIRTSLREMFRADSFSSLSPHGLPERSVAPALRRADRAVADAEVDSPVYPATPTPPRRSRPPPAASAPPPLRGSPRRSLPDRAPGRRRCRRRGGCGRRSCRC